MRFLSPIVGLRLRLTPVTHQIYEQMPNEKGTPLYKIQKKFQNAFGFTLPLFHGRGILNRKASQPVAPRLAKLTALTDNWGLLPYHRQIIAVSE